MERNIVYRTRRNKNREEQKKKKKKKKKLTDIDFSYWAGEIRSIRNGATNADI